MVKFWIFAIFLSWESLVALSKNFTLPETFVWDADVSKMPRGFTRNRDDKCGKTVKIGRGENFEITSPGYPRVYRKLLDCQYKIGAVNPQDRVQMRCDVATLIFPDNCK